VASHVLEKWRRRASSGNRGRQHSGHPGLSLPSVFTDKYKGREHKKRGQKRAGRPKEKKKKEKKKRENGLKTERKKRREKQRKKKKNTEKGRRQTAAWNHRHRWPSLTTEASPGKPSTFFSFAFISSLAMQDVHGARLCRRGEAGYCAHA
jgi:hypothetical protein